MNAIAQIQPSRLPIAPAVAKEFNIQSAEWRVLVEQIFPNAKTVEAVTMALSYCRARNLDIYKKPVHVVPMWSTALGKMVETVWPGIAEIRTTAARTGEYAGIDEVQFGPMVERTFTGQTGSGSRAETISKVVRFPEWASVVVYRFVKGQKIAFHTKIFWEETYASIGKSDVPNDMWARRPRGQFDKCVEAAALRKAFPEEVGSMYAAEEMEGRVIDHDAGQKVAPQPPKPPTPPAPPADDVQEIEETPFTESGEPTVEEVAAANEAVVDDTTYFEQLEEAMAVVSDAASIEEVWTEFDPLARFEGQQNAETNQAIAKAIRKRAEKRIGGAA
ncbi:MULTISPECIES: phage recombination protein Bet [unclassified Rhizobium]|uniref:phage recombination protein Bet n=1 Tax=unclassified Rhizobium TaxID=2613769 RepID=UPI00381266FE